MARISDEVVIQELKKKGLTLDPRSEPYQNLSTVLTVVCNNGHLIQSNLKTIRSPRFRCVLCEGIKSKGFDNAPVNVPKKDGKYRVIGIDNATQNMGVSIFDDGKLVYYNLYNFVGAPIKRLNDIRDWLEEIVIPEWDPDFMQFEDIQFQGSYPTYELLSKLIGVCEMSADRYDIEYDKVKSSVWRSHVGINGGKRTEEKKKAVDLVRKMYNITVGDDVAEAILIGKYRSDLVKRNSIKNLF